MRVSVGVGSGVSVAVGGGAVGVSAGVSVGVLAVSVAVAVGRRVGRRVGVSGMGLGDSAAAASGSGSAVSVSGSCATAAAPLRTSRVASTVQRDITRRAVLLCARREQPQGRFPWDARRRSVVAGGHGAPMATARPAPTERRPPRRGLAGRRFSGSGAPRPAQWKMCPPLTSSAWPVTTRDRSEAKKSTASAISAEVGMWLSAVRAAIWR